MITAFSDLTLFVGRWSNWCHCYLTISWFIKIQNGSAFLVSAYPGCSRKRAVKRVQ